MLLEAASTFYPLPEPLAVSRLLYLTSIHWRLCSSLHYPTLMRPLSYYRLRLYGCALAHSTRLIHSSALRRGMSSTQSTSPIIEIEKKYKYAAGIEQVCCVVPHNISKSHHWTALVLTRRFDPFCVNLRPCMAVVCSD